jgi:hypothetical protein
VAREKVIRVDGTTGLKALLVAIAQLDHATAADLLAMTPPLATLTRRDEFFVAERLAQVYEGDTVLHAAVIGAPGSAVWNPARQRAVIRHFVEVRADPNAPAAGGVTPLHAAWFFEARSGRAKGRSESSKFGSSESDSIDPPGLR